MAKAQKKPAQPVQMIEQEKILQALQEQLGKRFANHYRCARDCPAGAEVDLFWHEDLDEVQAYTVADIEGGEPWVKPIASICLHGALGANRPPVMAALRQGLRSLGVKIRIQGATWQRQG
jgi:hypothetical protein